MTAAVTAATSVTPVAAPASLAQGTDPAEVSVCGSSYNDAIQNICTNQRCPNGDVSRCRVARMQLLHTQWSAHDNQVFLMAFPSWLILFLDHAIQGCAGNGNCYALLAIDCSVPQPITATVVSVCGANYTDATQHICTNQACPNGDVSVCTVVHIPIIIFVFPYDIIFLMSFLL